MATVTGLTAARMLAIEAASVVDGDIVGSNLILTKHDGSTINAGAVTGPTGPTGPPGTSVPSGGTQGQILEKVSSTNYDFVWSTLLRAVTLSTKTASYALTLGDAEDMVLVDNVAATTVTVPPNSTTAFPLGTRIRLASINTGLVSIAGDVGVTLRYPTTQVPTLLGRGATCELIKINTDEWILDGHGNLADISVPWTNFTPSATATTSGPTMGGNDQRKGVYAMDTLGRVIGSATIRFGSTGSPGRGSGTYRLTLPIQGNDYEDQSYGCIGGGAVGIAGTHTAASLHFNGITPSTNNGVLAIQGGLFLNHSQPAGSAIDLNIHYHFAYRKL